MRTNAVMSTLSCAQLKPAVAVLANREISNSFRHVSLQRSAARSESHCGSVVDPTESQKANGKRIRRRGALHWVHCGRALTGRW